MLANQVQGSVVPNRRSDLSLSFQRWTTEGCNSQRLHDAGTNNWSSLDIAKIKSKFKLTQQRKWFLCKGPVRSEKHQFMIHPLSKKRNLKICTIHGIHATKILSTWGRVDHCGIFGLNVLIKDSYDLKKWGTAAAGSAVCRNCFKSSLGNEEKN